MIAIYMFSKRIQVYLVDRLHIGITSKALEKLYVELRLICSCKINTHPVSFDDVTTSVIEQQFTDDTTADDGIF